jgi:hypothetical protein
LLLSLIGFVPALLAMAGTLLLVLVATMLSLSWGIGKAKAKVKFTQLFSKSREINFLPAARFFAWSAGPTRRGTWSGCSTTPGRTSWCRCRRSMRWGS